MLRLLTLPFAYASTRSRRPSKKVAIVVPLSSRPELTADEQTSLRQFQHHLGHLPYDKYLIAPPSSPITAPGFKIKRFPERFFGSVAAHNRLMYAPSFYRTFSDYRYIFFYHLDALVFSDQLDKWCASDLDYVGAPWINCSDTPWVTRPRVGNSGFGLQKVRSSLDVLYQRYRKRPATFWLDLFTRHTERALPVVNFLRRIQPRFPKSRLIKRVLEEWDQLNNPARHNRHSDVFWSDKAAQYLPSFQVASLEQGLQFAFEASPRTCFKLNGGVMPFGCHAWARYDRKFWEPHLVPHTQASATRKAATSVLAS